MYAIRSYYVYAKNIEVKNGKFVYEVVLNGENLGEFKLSIPGKHNVSNSLGVIYLALKSYNFV